MPVTWLNDTIGLTLPVTDGFNSAEMALNRRLLHDETGMKTIGQITEIGVVSQ